MNRRFRRFFMAFLAVFALLGSQLAVSAHFCNVMAGSASHAAMDMAGDGAGCPEVDTHNLCEQHCSFGNSAVDSKQAPALDTAPATPFAYVNRPPVAASPVVRNRYPVLPPEPPPAIRFSVLRI